MPHHILMRVACCVGAIVVLPAVVTAAPQLTVIASGLDNPRGLAFVTDDVLYVAEAGLGASDGQGGFGVGVGLTGAISEIRGVRTAHPTVRRIVTRLVSVGGTENGFPEVVGPDGLSAYRGLLYVAMCESTPGMLAEGMTLSQPAAAQLGRLLRITPGVSWARVGDVGGYNYHWTENNQDQPWAPADQFPDANPYGVLIDPTNGRRYVVDAGANTVVEVQADGSIRVVAYVPNPLFPPPAGGPPVVPISDSVPTCVVRGPDGFLYIGTLAFGANFARFDPSSPPLWKTLPPQSKIYRCNPALSNQFLTEADVWAAGFNPITAIAYGGHAFFVTEYVTQESNYLTGDVVRIAVASNGAPGARKVFGKGALAAPNGLALDADADAIYVSNMSISAGGGEVVRVNF